MLNVIKRAEGRPVEDKEMFIDLRYSVHILKVA